MECISLVSIIILSVFLMILVYILGVLHGNKSTIMWMMIAHKLEYDYSHILGRKRRSLSELKKEYSIELKKAKK